MPNLLLDNSVLGNIFSVGAQAGVQMLDWLKSQYNLYMTDISVEEATTDPSGN